MEYSVFLSEFFLKIIWTRYHAYHCEQFRAFFIVWVMLFDIYLSIQTAELLISRWKLIKDNIFQRTI